MAIMTGYYFLFCCSSILFSVHLLSCILSDDVIFCLSLVDIEDRQVDEIGVVAVRWYDGAAIVGWCDWSRHRRMVRLKPPSSDVIGATVIRWCDGAAIVGWCDWSRHRMGR